MSFGTSTFDAAIGRWENGSTLTYGGRQGSGPLVLFDKTNNALVMGPSSTFTLASLWQDVDNAYVYWGIMGGVTTLPAGFQYSLALLYSQGKVGDAVAQWGFALRSDVLADKSGEPGPRAIPVPGNLLGSLGYWTGPGSAYYASPESGKTYDDTLLDVRLDAANDTDRVPSVDYLHVEVDDWWYQKGQGGGVKTWSAPASVFPDGVAGMANKTQWLVAASCGVWAPDNTYSKQNGGNYDFLAGDACALPNDQAFWNDLFNSTVESKVRVFVQKDMEQQYLCMTSGDSDVDTIMTWLSQLNVSATERDMEVMYSGSLPRLAMEAAFRHTLSPVVQVGSGKAADANHWKVGVANIFVSAIGLRPFFGIIKSYNDSASPNTQLSPMLYGLLATLTGGPVALGDERGKSDRLIIERCCSMEGRVLSPMHPAIPIDAELQQIAWGGEEGATGEIWTAYTGTSINSGGDVNFYHGVIMATAMTRPFNITPSNTGLFFDREGEVVHTPTKLFSYYNAYVLHDFSDTQPFTLTGCTVHSFCLYYVAPVFNFKGKDVVLMGDLTKWVPMSSQRVQRVEIGETITVFTRGVPDEKVYMWFHVDGHLHSLEHRIGLDGTGSVVYELASPGSQATRGSSVNYVSVLCAVLFALLLKL
ncbi:uncharacterized protein [Littorina saxatilis]|uniref:uncharacterized protein isoform X2 n=1 Tax=Littorina saxatilis TaxID=31220 RepID=UPI0038B5C4BA